jgi:LPPG:FO 2-phospho-L-lactate transferase
LKVPHKNWIRTRHTLDQSGIDHKLITVIAGGTGSAKLVRAIAKKVRNLKVISNVADNIWLFGLYICPDIDTMIYALSGYLDLERGWGMKQDSFNFLEQLKSLGYEAWFKIGDKDLATHVIRTKMMREGYSLSSFTEWMRMRYNLSAKIIPFTNDHVETRVTTEKGEMHIQEFWVKNSGMLEVKDIKFQGLDTSIVNQEAIHAIDNSETIVIAPGNPISSIGPIISHKSIRAKLIQNRDRVLAVSPIIRTHAISGPTAKYMNALGMEVSAVGIASLYSKFLGNFIVSSEEDWVTTNQMKKLGINVHKTNILMENEEDENSLARFVLNVQKKQNDKDEY